MTLGDADLDSGLFFADFGETVVFGPQSAKGNFDAPGKDALFQGVALSDQEYRIELGKASFIPFPEAGATLVITTGLYAGSYKVRAVNPMDDGKLVEVLLRSLD